ncbi:MAG: hypothetical protein ACRCZF_24460 [Gemmataceae bacterium]
MEEVLAVVVQILFEVLLQMLLYLPFEMFNGFSKKTDEWIGWGFIYFFVGGGLGWLSTFLWPHYILPTPLLRLTNLLAAPLIAGALSFLLADYRKKKFGAELSPTRHFYHGAIFSFVFGLVRYAYAVQ